MSLRSEVIRIYNELIAGAKKISGLTASGALDGTELVEIVQNGTNVKTTTQDIADLGGGGGAVSSVFGRTGAVTAQSGDYSKSDVGLGNVDNTSDANKPVSTAQATADGLRVLIVNSSTALTDAGTIDLTAIKHTLTTSSSRTFTISYTGDDITIELTLSATSATQTFPATALCSSEGVASGDNTLALAGVSGDKYIIAIKKIGSAYYVVSKNFGQ